ncbi:unnamed protein product [Larinioides sclopetarius]|uniref:Uncharacterized protein n=1 Tax=Larinioides sclopetarius TaxID=280406 RepID=A0AAV2BBP1_9ARAC
MATLKEFLITRKSGIMEIVLKRKPKNKRLSELLTSQAECVSTEDSELSFLFLALPCLMQEEVPLFYVEECTEIAVLQPIVVDRCHRNLLMNSYYELYLDKQLITTAEDLLTAVTLWFCLFWLFDVGYNKHQIKLLSFMDTYIFKKCSVKTIPRSIKSLFNAM